MLNDYCKTKPGIEILIEKQSHSLCGKSLGMLVNQASVDSRLRYSFDILMSSDKWTVKALFGPQHGLYGTTQENMITWKSFIDGELKIPVYSLYGETRKPTGEMLQGIELFLIDLQDVGARYYTYLWTSLLTIRACAEHTIPVIVLDRPNPIADTGIHGPLLDPEFSSFVGLYPLPISHSMTIGEILRMINEEQSIGCTLEVIEMEGWKRNMSFHATGLPWVPPSPNMPTPETALVYPGFCLLEGTNLSEGRGTTRPFEIFGSPFVQPRRLTGELNNLHLPGCYFRPVWFQPTFHKYRDKICGGAQIHVTDRYRFDPVKAAVAVLQTIYRICGKTLCWRRGPYEYEEEKLPFDILAGSDTLRKQIMANVDLENIEAGWEEDLEKFRASCAPYLLYEPIF
jgi:uncharacterized protein YbbC (DUF1343 family)